MPIIETALVRDAAVRRGLPPVSGARAGGRDRLWVTIISKKPSVFGNVSHLLSRKIPLRVKDVAVSIEVNS